MEADIVGRIATLGESQKERLLQAVMETLVEERGELIVKHEDSARELLAGLVSKPERSIIADDVLRPSVDIEDYIAATLDLLVSDPDVRRVVQRELDQLQPESQMFVDPVTAAVVLGALVVFLQTKFDAEFSRKDGKASFKVVVKREAASDKVVEKVIDSVRNVVLR